MAKIVAYITEVDADQNVVYNQERIIGSSIADIKKHLKDRGFPTSGEPVFVDTKTGKTLQVGWSKDNKEHYPDNPSKKFRREVYVELAEERPIDVSKRKKLQSMV